MIMMTDRCVLVNEGVPSAATIDDLPNEVTDDRITLRWSEPQNNGRVITQYTVYQRIVTDDETGEWIVLKTIPDVSVRELNVELESGKVYEFVITATNELGESLKEDEKIMRRKDHDSRNHSLEAKGRIEMRKNSQAKTSYSIMKLPLIETQSRPNKTRRWSKRSIMKDEDEHFLPNIDVVGNSRTNVRGARVKEPSRDPRFQGLISSLMINADYYGDLQRFAPPRREISKQTRLGLGF